MKIKPRFRLVLRGSQFFIVTFEAVSTFDVEIVQKFNHV